MGMVTVTHVTYGEHMGSIPNVLTIAGSDSGGGAGIQADLKTMSALGAYGLSVVTALTAQNTQGVKSVHAPPTEFVREQLDAVLDDIRVDAVKIGMLATAEIARGLLAPLSALAESGVPVVLDPVMVSTSGDRLLREDAEEAVREVARVATLVTPNIPEAAVLCGRPPASSVAEMTTQGEAVVRSGVDAVLVKGGHLAGAPTDVLVDGRGAREFAGERVESVGTHGTGCTLSSAIATLLARGFDLDDAVREAKSWLTAALRDAGRLDVGDGEHPVHHFHAWW